MNPKPERSDAPLVWNVYVSNVNAGEIEVHNIFDHWRLMDDLKKIARKYGKDREQFEEKVRIDLMYYYWSKCEWEIILSHWPNSDRCRDLKIDVWDQIEINWPHFIEYLWSNAAMLRRRPRKKKSDADNDEVR